MPSRSVTVTYTFHPPSSPVLNSAIKGIQAQLPLRNLHWKPSTRTALRTIQELNVTFLELGDAGTSSKEPNGSVLESPLVNLCLVTCENDEVYKNQTRSFIRDWLSLLAARRNVYVPLVVLVNPTASAASGKNVFGRDKGVFGKLKTDFNLNKKERCVQLNLPAEGTTDPAAWPDVMNKLKESIVSAFDGAVVEREEEVKRGEAQRLTVGWNFCTWFLLKESLAYSFEGVNLFEDALIVYEELEASFFQILKEQNLSWFGKLGATGSKDDSTPILDTTVKPYRDYLQRSLVTIFDFRIYVFARQAQLLGKIGRITEIAKRGQWFIASLARRLRESEGDLAEHFIESWTYTACMNIVQKCDEWSRIDRPNGDYSGLIAYESARSELLDIARTQIERIGIACGHLPNEYPFAPSSSLIQATDDVLFESSDNGIDEIEQDNVASNRPSLSNGQLVDAMKDVKRFREFYQHLTRKAISAYEACGKANSVIRLKVDLAALSLLAEDWQRAYELCRQLAKDCANLAVWEAVARFALRGALLAHDKTDKEKDEDWVNLVLAYMRTCSILEKSEISEDSLETLQYAISALRKIKLDISVESHDAFKIRLLGDTARFTKYCGVTSLSAEIKSLLPVPVQLNSICLDFEDSTGERVSFSTENALVDPGSVNVELSCSTSANGLFTLRQARIYIGSIELLYAMTEVENSVSMRRDPRGCQASLALPRRICLDQEQSVVLRLTSGEEAMKDVKLYLQSLHDDILYDSSKASSEQLELRAKAELVDIDSIDAGTTAELTLPYRCSSQHDHARARIYMQYNVSHDQKRAYIDTQSIALGLPLTVNVQDFFRPESLISHFTIASDGMKYLRIGSVTLTGQEDAGVAVQGGRDTNSSPSILTPAQPLSCLFKLNLQRENRSKHEAVLRLVIEYTSVADEMEELADKIASEYTSDSIKAGHIRRAPRDQSKWLDTFLATKSISKALATAVGRISSQSDTVHPVKLDEQILEQLDSIEKVKIWRTLEIPVDIPQHRLLTSARFERTSLDTPVYEGRAISMTLHLNTHFTWVSPDSKKDVKLLFDVHINGDDWVILGKKKGFYTAEANVVEKRDIVLVPVRSGALSLPHVSIQLLDRSSISNAVRDDPVCETYVENAAESIDVLPTRGVNTIMAAIQ